MINRINQIMELANKEKYLVLKQAIYKEKNYYVALQVTDDEENITEKVVVFEQVNVNGQESVQKVSDPSIATLVCKYVGLVDEAQLKKCTFYRGTLGHYDGATPIKDFSVLVVFFSKADTTQLSVLREYDGEYVELLYDYKTHALAQSDEGLTRLQKLERIELLSDDKYECEVEILKSTINNEGK